MRSSFGNSVGGKASDVRSRRLQGWTVPVLALCASLGACREPVADPGAEHPPAAAAVTQTPDAALPAPTALDQPVEYRCADGLHFQARYGENEVALLLDGGVRVLSATATDTGVRYEGEQVVLSNTQTDSTLEIDGRVHRDCREQATAAAAPTTPPFVASGLAPDWQLSIQAGGELELKVPADGLHIRTAAPPALEDEGAIVYHARERQHVIFVRIEARRCTEAQRDDRLAASVTVQVNDHAFHGCGGTLATGTH